jgi:hypothetical protein
MFVFRFLSRGLGPARTLKEFRKTAKIVAKPPWSLHRARDYLNDLCDGNVGAFERTPITLTEVFRAGTIDAECSLLFHDKPKPECLPNYESMVVRTLF